MVGFEEETEMLIEQLVTGPRHLDVVSIVGMPGNGKTTLAKRLYDHDTILNRFDIRTWCCTSQSYDRRALLFELLEHICMLDDSTRKKSDGELAEKLYRHLKGKRYLIVVDDVWSPEAWEDMRRPFPDDNNGSRIILTTRLESAATCAKIYSSPHYLRLFTEEESWMLMKEKVFIKEDYKRKCAVKLQVIGRKIAKKCGGLPLAIVLVAGLLAKQDKEVVYWEEVDQRLKSKMEGCMDIIETSYQHLPVHLQNCFLYFASFKEDQIVRVRKLIRLWIAEGFVDAANTSKSLEMLGMDYLMELINNSLIIIAKRSTLGEPKTVYIHDLLHEFCLARAEKDNFMQRIDGTCELNSPWSTRSRRVSISAPGQVVLLGDSSVRKDIRSISFRGSRADPNVHFDSDVHWEHLRVLDLFYASVFGTTINSLPYMMNLRYLDLYAFNSLKIPDWIINFKKLETLIVKNSVPSVVWDMTSLRHLVASPLHILREELEDLYNLRTCSNLVIFPGRDYNKFMKKFPNVDKLYCKLYGSGTLSTNFFLSFDSLIHLKTLRIDVSGAVVDPYGFEDFTYPSNLKKLTLVGLELPWSKISTISRLSNLEVLKLDRNAFRGRQWDVTDGEFPNLKVLKLRKLDISEWTASDYSYPMLQQVQIRYCWSLKEIPESFGSKCTMQGIEFASYAYSADALKIKEMQIEEMGNSEFKLVHTWQW